MDGEGLVSQPRPWARHLIGETGITAFLFLSENRKVRHMKSQKAEWWGLYSDSRPAQNIDLSRTIDL